ncbi:hypothetical protein CkaCkLH20_07506 [Colletotrichum karsti]|uniref:Apple domain-containing protein n=1 Tax=Colletotrichum karsti TaxID=1095194 RepID=A0A9P6I0P6_9PEZI|nr:uncharacterized protein CkaCkLH20_07506 [Colletotrichum karsti]KAF9874812.1 hypothetical protein CkaCkLH20_07506 [Colletotrichum karsti]
MVCSKTSAAALAALLLQGSFVLGQVNDVQVPTPTTSPPRTVTGEYGCYTDFVQERPESVETLSRVYSHTSPITYYHYVTPFRTTVTVTPSPLPPPSATAPATITITDTVTSYTRTTSFTIQSIPTPAGFIPLSSAVYRPRDDFGNLYIDQSDGASEDADTFPNAQHPLKLSLAQSQDVVADPPFYPERVVCERVVRIYTTTTETYTVTGTFTTTVTAATPSPTIPSVPAQVTTTTTYTTTSTWQVVMPNPTFTAYEACQANNMVSRAPGDRPIVEAANDWSVTREERYAESAYDCCVFCQREDKCTGSLYFRNVCYTFRDDDDTCATPGELRWSRRASTKGAFVASNGMCGSWRLSRTPPSNEGF